MSSSSKNAHLSSPLRRSSPLVPEWLCRGCQHVDGQPRAGAERGLERHCVGREEQRKKMKFLPLLAKEKKNCLSPCFLQTKRECSLFVFFTFFFSLCAALELRCFARAFFYLCFSRRAPLLFVPLDPETEKHHQQRNSTTGKQQQAASSRVDRRSSSFLLNQSKLRCRPPSPSSRRAPSASPARRRSLATSWPPR